MKIVSVINYKGGVGKTTLTANLAAELAYQGKRVLLLDMDAQCSLTFSFILPDEWKSKLSGDGTPGSDRTIKSWFDGIGDDDMKTPSLEDLILSNLKVASFLRDNGGRIDLIPSHLGLINVDLDLAYMLTGVPPGRVDRQRTKVYGLLRSHLGRYVEKAKYDVVLIDCPPNFNIVTKNAIMASDGILTFPRQFERTRQSLLTLPKMGFPLYCIVTAAGRMPRLFQKSKHSPRSSVEEQV